MLARIKNAAAKNSRSIFVQNTPECRDVLCRLQKLGYISRFVAVDCRNPPEVVNPENQTDKRFLVFMKAKLHNKNQNVINGISWKPRPVSTKRPCQPRKMRMYMRGHGHQFIETKEGHLTTYECVLRNLGGNYAFNNMRMYMRGHGHQFIETKEGHLTTY